MRSLEVLRALAAVGAVGAVPDAGRSGRDIGSCRTDSASVQVFRGVVLRLILLAVAVTPAALHAQWRSDAMVGVVPPVAVDREAPLLDAKRFRGSERTRGSYWLEGGIASSLLLVLASRGYLRASERPFLEKVARAVFIGGVGFAPGALIGGQIPKRVRSPRR